MCQDQYVMYVILYAIRQNSNKRLAKWNSNKMWPLHQWSHFVSCGHFLYIILFVPNSSCESIFNGMKKRNTQNLVLSTYKTFIYFWSFWSVFVLFHTNKMTMVKWIRFHVFLCAAIRLHVEQNKNKWNQSRTVIRQEFQHIVC